MQQLAMSVSNGTGGYFDYPVNLLTNADWYYYPWKGTTDATISNPNIIIKTYPWVQEQGPIIEPNISIDLRKIIVPPVLKKEEERKKFRRLIRPIVKE